MATPVIEVKGIGPSTATVLKEHGIASAEDLAGATISQVAAVRGFSDIRAAQVIADAKMLLNSGSEPSEKKKVAKKSEKRSKKVEKKPAKKKAKDKKVKKEKKTRKVEKPAKKDKKSTKKKKK
ncbi:MAG: helix-hairpin-helix domain-containing protein [Desulfuromonadales bacterium]|nr:helix-hairpin-helix domain-containing protein [Desulfuromonadales bacterium]